MNWLLPSALGIGGAAALVAAALHLIGRNRPLTETLPTARFVPDRPVHARTRSFAPSDLLLLLLRLGAIAAIGAAVAGPIVLPRGRTVRIIAMDRSRSVRSLDEVRDSVRVTARAGDVIIPFDTATFGAIKIGQLDSLRQSSSLGSLSTALAAVTHAAVELSPRADSIEAVIVSPVSIEEVDDATAHLRGAWPGRIRVIPVRSAEGRKEPIRVEARAPRNDAVVAGLGLMGILSQTGNVRVVRGQASAADSTWAAQLGHVLVVWPRSDSLDGWPHRLTPDSIGAVSANGATLVANFPRRWKLEGRAIARWADGDPAVVERTRGDGCIRDVGVPIDEASDVALRAPFRAFAREIIAPCGGARATEPADSAVRALLAGTGSLAAAAVLRDLRTENSKWTPWLLVLGALLLVAELAARRTMRGSR